MRGGEDTALRLDPRHGSERWSKAAVVYAVPLEIVRTVRTLLALSYNSGTIRGFEWRFDGSALPNTSAESIFYESFTVYNLALLKGPSFAG